MGWSLQGPTRVGLLILLTVFFTDARECKISCHGSPGNTLRFEPGKVYNYKLEGQSVTTVTGSAGEASKLGITADVQVAVLSSCEHVLKVTNVHTSAQDGKKHSLSKLSQQPVKFGLQNGHIDSELCVNDAEDSVGLNIKRAVLSMIQSTVLKDSGHGSQSETDIFGTCPTGFEFSKSGGTLTITKNKDLNKCAHREEITMPFLTTPYYLKSDIQALPYLASSLKSEQKIEAGVLKSAKLEEHYQHKPGTIAEATSKVTIKTQLTFANAAPGAIPAACTVPRSIIFEQEHAQEEHGISNKIVDLVRQGCDSRVIEENTAEKFSKLVKAVSAASKTDINQALQHVKSGPGIKDRNTAQTMLLDAIVMAQSGSAVEVMADILKKKEVSGNTARMWLLALGAVKHATKSSLTAVLPLLDGEHPDVNAYLGIGSLAGKFCREHSCDGVNEVNQLQIKLGAPLLKGCKVGSVKEEDQIIASLKGLGNIKYLGPKIAGKIAECASDESVSPRIRVAALETIATDAHKDQFKTLALNILKNVNEDSELRIKAFLVLMKCPCGKVASEVQDLLNNKQTSNQVGGYIVSYLRNLHASTNPDKAAAKHHLGNIIPPHRFIIDPRRYSVNQELSYSNGLINSGGSGEVDIIYSQNSYIPRSVNLNLTSQIFGTAYNLLELDLRVENIERVAEAIFGPKGYIQSNHVEDYAEHGQRQFSQVLEEIAARYEKTLRPKRSITRDQLNNIANKVHLPPSSENIDLDLSMKFLGNEVAWTHLHGLDALKLDNRKVINGYFDTVDSVLHSMKNSDVDYRRHFTFLDRELTYPTGLGLALRLKAFGTAALRVKLDGKIDIPAILRDPTNTDIRFQLIPSAAINFGGELVMDGVAVETGVRMDLNIHTSTGSDIALRLLDGRGVDVKIGLPVPKQELFTLKTHFNSIIRDDTYSVSSSPIKYETPRETYEGCFDQLNAISGLTFCGVISGPYEEGKPLVPFYGPISLAVSINKEDKSLSSYHFKAYYNQNEDFVHSVELLLDTPNSNTNRKLSFTLDGATRGAKKFLSAKLSSPWTTATLNANVINTNKEDSIDVKFIHDGTEYSLRFGTKNDHYSSTKRKFEPIFEYKSPEPAKSALIGKKGGQKQKTQLISTVGYAVVENSPGTIKVTFHGLGISTPRTTYTLDGTFNSGPQVVNGDLKVSYEKEHVTIKGNSQHNHKETTGNLEIAPSQYPDLGISANLEVHHDPSFPRKYDSKLTLVHGPDPKSEVSRIYIHSSINKSGKVIKIGKTEFFEFSALHEIKYPVIQLDAGVKAVVTNNELSGGFKGKLDKYSAKFEYGIRGDINKEFEASLDTEFMGQELKLLTTHIPEGPKKSRITNVLILKPGGTYQLNALVNYDVSDTIDLSVDADGSIPSKSAFKLSAAYQAYPTKYNNKLKLHLGEKCFVDYSLQVNRGATPNGNFKLSVPEYLESDGKFTNDGSHSNLVSQFYLPKIDRRMEAKGDFTIKRPKFSGVLSVCYDTKDPKKTFKIETDSDVDVAENHYSLDSKNTFSLGEFVVKVNGKGKVKGTSILNYASDGEFEVISTTGWLIGGNFQEKLNFNENVKEAEANLELFNQPPGEEKQKLQLKVVGKHLDLQERTIDGQASLSYTSRNKKDIHAHINVKKQPSSKGSSNIALEVGSTGSLIEYPVIFKFDSELSNEYLDLDESLSLEDDLPPLSFRVSGKVGENSADGVGKIGKPSTLELTGRFPDAAVIKKFKLSSSTLIDLADGDSKENRKVKLNNALYWNDNRHVKLLLEGYCEENGGRYVAEYETDSIPKTRLTGSGHYAVSDNIKGDVSLAVVRDGKTAEVSVKGEATRDGTDTNLHAIANLESAIENGVYDIVFKNKIVKEGRGLNADLVVTQKGQKKMTGNAKVELDHEHPCFEVNFDCPQGKTRFLYKYDKKSDHHYTSELVAKWPGKERQYSITADNEFNMESIDNFVIKGNVEAPQLLEASPVHIEIVNKPAKGEAKKITFLYKEGDKVIASGSTNYNFKEEGDLSVLEGNGNIKYKDQSYPLNFQASKQLLTNGRVGKLTVKAGKMSLNIENKMTPEEFSMERTFCKEPKSCSKAQISSKFKSNLENDEHKVIVYLDLSLLNPKLHDISYKYDYKRNDLIIDHNVEFQWANDAKMSSHAYAHDNNAGVYLTFPKRTIGGEVKYETRTKDNKAQLRVESEFHINKGKEPKLSLVAGTTTVYDKGAFTVAGEAKVIHPSLGKDLVAKGQLSISDKPSKLVEGLMEIDVSPDSSKKLIGKLKVSGSKESAHTWATLTCTGCNIEITYEEKIKLVINGKDSSYSYTESLTYLDSKNSKREFLGKFEASAKRIHAVGKSPDVHLEADIRTDKGYSGNLIIFGKKYHDTLTYNKDANTLTYHLTGLAGGKSLTVEAGGKIGGIGVFKASLGEKKACSIDVALDEANFLKSKYAVDKDVIKSLYTTLADEVKHAAQDCSKGLNALYERQLAEGQRIIECFNKAKPNVTKFLQDFERQLDLIKNEVHNDKTLQEALKYLDESDIGKALAIIIDQFLRLVDVYFRLIEEAYKTIESAVHEIGPKIKSSIQRISKVFNDLLEQSLKLSVELVEWALDEIKKHQDDIDQFAKTVLDLLEDIGKQISQITISVHSQLDELIKHNVETLKEIPLVTSIEEKWAELKELLVIPEEVLGLVHELIETVKQFLPTEESSKFVTTLGTIIEKALKHEEIKNRDEVMKQLYKEFVAAVKSIIAILGQHAPQAGVLKPTKLQNLPILSFLRIPSGTFRFSLLNLFTSEDYLPSIQELVAGLKISLNPLNNLPPYKGHAFVIAGSEIVTFDGVHLSIPAECTYVLSEDYKDRNFSIVGQISKGALISITLTSRTDSIELRADTNPVINGKEHGYPAFAGDFVVWRRPASIGVWSSAGVLITCLPSMKNCHFSVSGFYFGRVRGLFGNLNGEEYDDRLLPDGKIVGDTGSLANAWKLDGSCSIPSTADHKHVRDSKCTEMFTEEPLTLVCRPFVDAAPYRDACDHISKANDDSACLAVQAYTIACRENGIILAEIPESCATCKINGKTLKNGETISLRQDKEADIVLLVDQDKENEENYKQIAVPLVSALENELHKNGVSDVKVVTIGATPLSKYENFLTNKKGEISSDPSSNTIWFDEKPEEHNETYIDWLKTARHRYEAELGRAKMLDALIDTPYLLRPNSYRLVIGVFSRSCKLSFSSFATAILRLIEREVQGIHYTHISPIGGVEKDGKDIEKACVISENEALLAGGEKVDGIEYEGTDICVISTLASEGVALSANELKGSPQRPKLISSAASQIVKRAITEKQIFDCECSTWKGIVPHTECYV